LVRSFRYPPVFRNFQKEGNPFLTTEHMYSVVADSHLVDHDTKGYPELPHHVHGKLEVVQPEGRRLRDEHNEIRAPKGGDDRTRGPGRSIKNGGQAVL
jgi:hypothetical protein